MVLNKLLLASVLGLSLFLFGCGHGSVKTDLEEVPGIYTGEFFQPVGLDYKLQRLSGPDGKPVNLIWY